MADYEMTAPEVAEHLGVSQVALFHLRKRGTGPKWIDQRKPGAKIASIIYDRASVEAWANERLRRKRKPATDSQRIADLERRLSALLVRFIESEVEDWIAAKISARDAQTGPVA